MDISTQSVDRYSIIFVESSSGPAWGRFYKLVRTLLLTVCALHPTFKMLFVVQKLGEGHNWKEQSLWIWPYIYFFSQQLFLFFYTVSHFDLLLYFSDHIYSLNYDFSP